MCIYKWSNNNGYVEGLSIDRIDNHKDYCPENCRWVTMKVQQNNRTNNRILNIDGIEDTMANWSDKLNISYYKLQRLDYSDQYTYNKEDNIVNVTKNMDDYCGLPFVTVSNERS
jgi:hypothetical protein